MKYYLGLILLLLINSCSNEPQDNTTITLDEALISTKIDLAFDDIATIINDQYQNIDSNTCELSSCSTIERTPNFGTAFVNNDLVTKTIDFGSGCTLKNGNTVKGKLVLWFTYLSPTTPIATTKTLNYKTIDFYHNNNKIEVTDAITTTTIAATTIMPAHPKIEIKFNTLTATLATGTTHTRKGSQTREMTQGYSTTTYLDDEYSVTGSWTTSYETTGYLSSSITTPLKIKTSCITPSKPLITTGIVTFVRNNKTATVDYGNDSCDNLAQFMVDGTTTNLYLGN